MTFYHDSTETNYDYEIVWTTTWAPDPILYAVNKRYIITPMHQVAVPAFERRPMPQQDRPIKTVFALTVHSAKSCMAKIHFILQNHLFLTQKNLFLTLLMLQLSYVVLSNTYIYTVIQQHHDFITWTGGGWEMVIYSWWIHFSNSFYFSQNAFSQNVGRMQMDQTLYTTTWFHSSNAIWTHGALVTCASWYFLVKRQILLVAVTLSKLGDAQLIC